MLEYESFEQNLRYTLRRQIVLTFSCALHDKIPKHLESLVRQNMCERQSEMDFSRRDVQILKMYYFWPDIDMGSFSPGEVAGRVVRVSHTVIHSVYHCRMCQATRPIKIAVEANRRRSFASQSITHGHRVQAALRKEITPCDVLHDNPRKWEVVIFLAHTQLTYGCQR